MLIQKVCNIINLGMNCNPTITTAIMFLQFVEAQCRENLRRHDR